MPNLADKLTPVIGSGGTVAVFTLGEINSMMGILVGALTAAYMVRKHRQLSRNEKDNDE